MKALVIGGGFIGTALVPALQSRSFEVESTDRSTCLLSNLPDRLPRADVVFICAAMSKFIVCEADPLAYRVNVDSPYRIALLTKPAKVVFLSSEAVEKALHTNYGMQKALAEQLLLPLGARIARLSKVIPERLNSCCHFLIDLAEAPPGIYHWS